MSANLFNTIRKSYITHVFFTSVLSNLVVFGQPLQQIVQDYYNHQEMFVNVTSYNNNTKKAKDDVKGAALVNNFREKITRIPEVTTTFFAIEKQGVIGESYESGEEDVADNIFSISLPENISSENYDAVLLYDLYGLSSALQTTKSINNYPAYGGKIITKTNAWISVKEEILTDQLKAGANEIFFNRRADESYEYKIKNVRVELREKKREVIRLIESLRNLDGNLYLAGIVSNPDIKYITALGQTISINNGVFEQVLSNVSKSIKNIEISCKMVTGESFIIKFPVQYESKEIDYRFNEKNDKEEVYKTNELVSECITYSALGITIDGRYTKEMTGRVIVQGLLFKDMKALDADLQNVTAGDFSGYRIKKINLQDSLAIQLRVKYNPEMIPDGYTAKDIKTFYFDSNQRNWKALPVDSLDYVNKEIVTSIYNNETDFINGVIKVPESPETGSFAPTTITDMKYADPAAGVVSISPPAPNSTGTASTSFPIKLPQGRNGMQPSLAVTYNSEAGNSWMGIGWNLSVPAITLNTKWGAPVFNSTYESEIYSLNGSDLVYDANGYGAPHRTVSVLRSPADKRFYHRKEGSYEKIMRRGSSPSNYSWEVIDKQGNKSFYGGDDNYVVKDSLNNIAHWALKKMQDPYGNSVEYIYTKGSSLIGNSGVTAQEFYLTKIKYTMSSSASNYYEIDFIKNGYTVAAPGDTGFTPRKDIIVNARNGYIQLTDKLLTEIHVSFRQGSTLNRIRTYRFNYIDGPFDKKQLSSVAEFDTNGELFYSNTFEYYNDIGISNIISGTVKTWSSYGSDDDISSTLNDLTTNPAMTLNGSPLGTSVSDGFSMGMRGGLGIGYNPMSVSTTIGGSINYSQNKQDTRITLIDINGDGLPDKVFKDNEGVKYRPNTGDSFGGLIDVDGISAMSKTSSRTFGHGGDANALGLLGVGKSWSTTKTDTENYFTDFNGDGLPDIATGGRVRFNTTVSGQDYTHRDFDLDVNASENTIISGAVDPSIVGYLKLPTLTELRGEHPQFDHVKVWQAPYKGLINVTGSAILRQRKVNGHPNTFRTTIEKADVGSTGPTTLLSTGFPSTIGGNGVTMAKNFYVEKGDLIFFRIHNQDFGSGGEIEWNPTITYQSIQPWITDLFSFLTPDENGKQPYSYNAQPDFVLNNDGGMVPRNTDQTLTIKYNLPDFAAYQFSDNITFKIKQVQTNIDDGTEAVINIWERVYSHDSGTFTGSDTFAPLLSTGNYKDEFYFYADSNSNVDWSAINWKPQMIGENTGTRYPGVNYKTYDDNINQKRYWVYHNQLPSPIINNIYEEDDPFIVVRNTFFEQDYSGYLDDFTDAEFPLKASWVVKTQVGSNIAKAVRSRAIYIHKTPTGYKFTKSLNQNDILTPALHTDYVKYTFNKQQIKEIQDGTGKIYSAFYIEDKRLGIGNQSNVIFELSELEEANYPAFEIVLEQPVMTGNANFYGNAYRGWGQFLYNGGLGFEYDEQGNVTNTPPVFFSDNINMSVFKTDADAEELQNISYDEQPTSGMSETVIRYTFYNQQNPYNRYLNKSIKDSQYGYNDIGQLTAKVGRFAEADLYDVYVDPATITAGGSGIFVGMRQRSESKGQAETEEFAIFNGTKSDAGSQVLNMHLDLNGDRYPDVVSGKIQYTNMLGGLGNVVKESNFYAGDDSKDETEGTSVPGIWPNSSDSSNGKPKGNKTITNANAGINDSTGSSLNSRQWVDMNGDGLPDKVTITEGIVKVNLNQGYKFSAPIIWAANEQDVISTRVSNGLGGGMSFGSSFAAGFGGSESTANMNVSLFDVNGDGLPDFVFSNGGSYKYYLNSGKDFDTSQVKTFYGGSRIDQDYSVSGNVFGSYTGGFTIPTPLPGLAIKVTFSPSAGTNANISEKRATVQDINGDGLIDVLHKGSDANNNTIFAYTNNIGKTHLLKKVNTPLGGSWTIEYAANTKSYDMPNHKWLLNKIHTYDAFNADVNLRPNSTYREVSYTLPKYDRREREFFGYGEVIVQEKDATTPNGAAYRKTITLYHNENYYLSGAQKQVTLYGSQSQLLSQQKTLYNLLNPDAPIVNLNANEDNHFMQSTLAPAAQSYLDRSRLFVAVARVSSTSYEGIGGTGLTAVKEFTVYDAYGNIREYVDYGEGPEDTYKSKIEYHLSVGSLDNAVGFPKKITVEKSTNGLVQVMRQREATYNSLGKLEKVTTKLGETVNDVNRVDFTYNTYGNLIKVRELDNLNSLGASPYEVNITYDSVLNTFPVSFSNSFGETSATVYNYLFGIPVLTTDMNGESMRTRIDDRGRIVEVTGPNEMAAETSTSTWTIRMQYKGEPVISGNMPPTLYMLNAGATAQTAFQAPAPGTQSDTSQHYAVTRHFDPEITNNQFLTVSIVDGFGQPTQVKKTHWSRTTPTSAATAKWLISGFDRKDAFGRTTESYLPVVQNYPSNINTLSTADVSYFSMGTFADEPLKMEYDERDRIRKITQPGETAFQTISYTISDGMFHKSSLNELSQRMTIYTDIRGRQRRTIQNNQIGTTFEYNAINELVKVIDHGGFITNYKYDMAGRKTRVEHPDRGIQTFKYDKSGNVIEQSNSNLYPDGLKIKYSYNYNRLINVEYPLNPQNNVKYTYGTPGDALSGENNAVGRLLYQEDATGVQVFGYGLMGEVTKNLRSVAVAGYQSFWFFTKWQYDSWNRVQKITYPDQEAVNYTYNRAGMLEKVHSDMIGSIANFEVDIVEAITYNDYGERTEVKYGNGTKTNYKYDARRRMDNLTHAFNGMQVNNTYTYDVLSNITGIVTNSPQTSLPAVNNIGGPAMHSYQYDNFNRLKYAIGSYIGPGDATTPYVQQNYELKMVYNNDHTIRRKELTHTNGVTSSVGGTVSNLRPVQKTSYLLDYQNYATGAFVMGNDEYGYQQPHAPRKIIESPAWSNAPSQYIKTKEIKYDANGNQTEIKQKMGGLSVSLRKNMWDEENRLMGVDLKPDETTNHPIAVYAYDAGGERIVRYNLSHIDVSSNADEVGELRKDNIMIYPNGLVMAKVFHTDNPAVNRLVYTKHYYIGSERVSAKTGSIKELGNYPGTLMVAPTGQMQNLNAIAVRALSDLAEADALTHVPEVFEYFGVEAPALTNTPEDDKFNIRHLGPIDYAYFHKDHLGSSNYITNGSGKVSQHMEYMPFGETLVEEHVNSNNSPFKYNGKALDEETGNYYYGARYYDPKWSIFISVDPLAEKYPSISSYCYTLNNPLKFIDPDGRDLEIGNNDKSKSDITSLVSRKNRERLQFNEGIVTINFDGLSGAEKSELLKTDKGLALLNDIIVSPKKTLYEASDLALVRSSEGAKVAGNLSKDNTGIMNLSNNGKDSSGGYSNLPREGYDGHVIVSESGKWYTKKDGFKARSSAIFHELAENYYRTTMGYDYHGNSTNNNRGAHQRSIDSEGDFYNNDNPGNFDYQKYSISKQDLIIYNQKTDEYLKQ